jgi:cytidine deaminase
MQQRLTKAVLAAVQRHGHREPVLSCGRCRSVLTDHAQRAVVIPKLRRLAQNRGITLDDVMAALSKARIT